MIWDVRFNRHKGDNGARDSHSAWKGWNIQAWGAGFWPLPDFKRTDQRVGGWCISGDAPHASPACSGVTFCTNPWNLWFYQPHWPDEIAVQFVDQLYKASASSLLQAIIDYGGDLSDIAVIGHNPSLVVLLNHMVGDGHAEQNLSYFPTCCMADIGFVASKIRDLVSDKGRLLSIKRARDL